MISESGTQICSRCVMDASDPDITFDAAGICHYCRRYEPLLARLSLTAEESRRQLTSIAERVRAAGRGREYDCLVGVSGGVDSSYVAYLAKQLDLRPMVVHLDNGWNSEIAVENIRGIVEKLGFDLFTTVIDWEEFRDLQRAFFRASVVDIEMLTDHAHAAATYSIARKNGIRYVLSGSNLNTEHGMPPSWSWLKRDLTNIKAIHRRFGERKLRSYPTQSLWQWTVNRALKLVEPVRILESANYRKTDAMKVLHEELGWRYYGGKHYESVFTKFYQAYFLPEKFGIDKRKPHLSCLVRNGELSRDDALAELDEPLYDPVELRAEKEYVLKKLGFSEEEFAEIMSQPIRRHDEYPSSVQVYDRLRGLKGRLRTALRIRSRGGGR